MRIWYLRHAPPWAALGGCVAVAGVVTALVHRWEAFAGVGLPLAALASAAGTAFVLDEPAVAVTTVTPLGRRWAPLHRVAAVLLPLGAGFGLLATAPPTVRGSRAEWLLVLFGLTAAAVAAALVGCRRQLARPGAPIASFVVLAGLVPLVLGGFADWHSPFPAPELVAEVKAFWAVVLALGAVTCGGLLLDGTRP